MTKKILFLPLLILLFSCVKNNPDPVWLQVNEWQLVANSDLNGNEGELTHNLTNAWVYANGNLLGVFELPALIPILTEGTTDIQIYPAMLNNGISATKKIYPFVNQYQVVLNMEKNQTYTVNPITSYKTGVDFWIEDFNGANLKFEKDPNTSLANLVKANDPQYLKYGTGYGLIQLTPTDSIYVGYTNESNNFTNLPKGADIYLEIDYLNSNDIITGIIEISSQDVVSHPNIQMNDQPIGEEVWKKIYIDLREIISGTPDAAYYKLSLQAFLEAGGVNRKVLLDNIKVVHF